MSPAALLALLLALIAVLVAGWEDTTTPDPEFDSEDALEDRALRSSKYVRWDTDCSTPRRGKCVPRRQCPQLNRIRDPDVLEKYSCDDRDSTQRLCCPHRLLRGYPEPVSRAPPTKAPVTTRISRVPANLRALIPPSIPEECGTSHAAFAKIIGGTDAKKGDWPWQALVLRKSAAGRLDFICGGSLISKKHVLSAAHCFVSGRVEDSDAGSIRVRLGEHDRSQKSPDTVERAVERLITHEDFETGINRNDIALIVMDRDITFNRYISPVCLPYSRTIIRDNIAGENAYASGWGQTDPDDPGSAANILQMAFLSVWDSETCSDVYRSVNYVSISFYDILTAFVVDALSKQIHSGDADSRVRIHNPSILSSGIISAGGRKSSLMKEDSSAPEITGRNRTPVGATPEVLSFGPRETIQ